MSEKCQNRKWRMQARKEKAARRRLQSNLMIVDQAAINAALFFRRYAMNPTPAKPRISIAHVEGSGTAEMVPSIWNELDDTEVELLW
jgi:hypothetical protein